MSLPANWVNRIFDKLTLVYGQPFLRRWADLDLDAVKADWAHELDWFKDHPESVAWALQHLTANPPTVLEFRNIARAAPLKPVPMLEEPIPAPNPEIVAAVISGLAKPVGDDGKNWARKHLSRNQDGLNVRPYTLRLAREAMGIKPPQRNQ